MLSASSYSLSLYGDLGDRDSWIWWKGWLNKAETATKFGDAQVKIWRRAYETAPPPLEDGDPRLATDNPRYANLEHGAFPRTECLKDGKPIFAISACDPGS